MTLPVPRACLGGCEQTRQEDSISRIEPSSPILGRLRQQGNLASVMCSNSRT